jgi:hypothetical protein
MARFKHILAAGLIAIAFISLATPALMCLIRGKSQLSGHSCCLPANKVQDSRPEQTENSCCVTVAREDPSAPVSFFKSAHLAVAIVASSDGAVLHKAPFLSPTMIDDASPPGCASPSVLRI